MKKVLLFCLLISTLTYSQCPTGNVIFNSQDDVNDFVNTYPNCDILTNDLLITGSVTDLSALDYLIRIEGSLIIRDTQLTTISNFNTLTEVYNDIEISDNSLLSSIEGFNTLLHLSMAFGINNNPNLQTINGFDNAAEVSFGFWIVNNANLLSITGFSNLQNVGEFMIFNDCPKLTSIPLFNELASIGWSIQFYNTGMIDISGFENITLIGGLDPTSGLGISNNQDLRSISGFCSLERIEYDLLIQNNPLLVDLSGLKRLESIGQFFTIRNNASLATLNGFQSLSQISRAGYEGSETVSIHDNPMLTDCDPLCNVLTSNQIIGTVNFSNNLTGCNSVAEVNTTDCAPFETLVCTQLISPINGDVNVAIDTNITWEPITGATYYLISIGTTSGGNDIANRLDVGNITDYNLPNDLPPNTEIFVKVIPYSDTGNATCCTEERFTTENTTSLTCTTLSMPLNGATDVSVSTDFSWNAVSGATGYKIAIGTNTVLLDAATLTNVLFYDLDFNLPENTEIFVEITPYNSEGDAIGCLLESFFTGESMLTPNCTELTAPLNSDVDVSLSTNLSWSSVLDANGYVISIGTTSGGTDIVNAIDVGNTTSYNPVTDLPENTQIFVTIIPYNSEGQASGCLEERFITEIGIALPICTNLLSPVDGAQGVSRDTDLFWNEATNATGYILNIGTLQGGTDLVNGEDVGAITSYNLPFRLPENAQIYVTIIPYNDAGQTLDCFEERFSTIQSRYRTQAYFTPNNDNVHDVWTIDDSEGQIKAVFIFNRYGKLLKTLRGPVFSWDGYFNNQRLPASDYWYSIEFHSGENDIGHFALKL